MNRLLSINVICFFIFVLNPSGLYGKILDPINDIAWHGIFPIKIAGITVANSDLPKVPDSASKPVCICKSNGLPKIGIPVSFWEPSRFVETVRDPFYIPSLDTKIMSLSVPEGSRSSSVGGKSSGSFIHSHWFIFSPFALLELLTDFSCSETTDFDLAYMSELDPLWNDNLLSATISSETVLFANPAAQFSCIADAVSSTMQNPINPMFWCMGSWGSAYPLTGHTTIGDPVIANAATAAKTIFKLSRMLLIHDGASNLCQKTLTPIWKKNHFRFQLVKPTKSMRIIPIGQSSLVWGNNKHKHIDKHGESYLFMVFCKRACCAF